MTAFVIILFCHFIHLQISKLCKVVST